MKYTEAEVLDIIKCATDKDPQEILDIWVNRKANTPLNLHKDSYDVFVYTFPIKVESKHVADITLASLYGYHQGGIDNLMLKYLGKDDFEKSWSAFSHDTYLTCFLTIHKEFKLPEICEGLCGDTFQDIDANGRPFEFKVAYGSPEGEDDNHYYYKWIDKGYRFDNGVAIQVSQMNGWSLGKKINENIEVRLVPYKRAEKLNGILE